MQSRTRAMRRDSSAKSSSNSLGMWVLSHHEPAVFHTSAYLPVNSCPYILESLLYRTWKSAQRSWWTSSTESSQDVGCFCVLHTCVFVCSPVVHDHLHPLFQCVISQSRTNSTFRCSIHTPQITEPTTFSSLLYDLFFLVIYHILTGEQLFLYFRWWSKDRWLQHWVLQEYGGSHGCIL